VNAAVSEPREVIAIPNTKLTARAKVLYIAISQLCADGGGSTLATNVQMGRAAGMSDRAVQRGMAELLELGLVSRDKDREQPNSPLRTRLATPKRGKK
jgi:hypothetical protein